MRVPLLKRLTITACNIFFPPLAVGLLTGFTSRDTFLNSCLFLLAIIPSHIHGFYISITYFTRKRRARRGQWPGSSRKAGVWSEKVLTGGIGFEEARALRRKSRLAYVDDEYRDKDSDFDSGPVSRRSSRRSDKRRSQRASAYGNGGRSDRTSGIESRSSSRRVSTRPQSGIQRPQQYPVVTQTSTEPPMQNLGRVTSSRTQGSRTSRWIEDERTQGL